MASPMRCTRRAFVRAWGARRAARHHHHKVAHLAPGDLEQGPVDLADHVVGVRDGRDEEGSAPQVSASWLRVADSVVNASSGIGDRYLASRRAVSPVMVKATSALAPTAAPTSPAARAMAAPMVSGALAGGRTASHAPPPR